MPYLPVFSQDAGQDDLEDCRNLDRCVPATRTEDVMSMILQRTHNIVPTDLMLHVGDMSYADGNQVQLSTRICLPGG